MPLFGIKRKVLGKGAWGTVLTPNFPCPGLKSKTGFVSKMVRRKDVGIREIEVLKKIKKIDPNNKYLVSYEGYCPATYSQWLWYTHNIIMKNYGNALNSDGFKKKSLEHIKNVMLPQFLKGLILLYKNKTFQRDIATRNLLYDEKTNKYRIIDFGQGLFEIDEKITRKAINENIKNIEFVTKRPGDHTRILLEKDSMLEKIMILKDKNGWESKEVKDFVKNINIEELKKQIIFAQEKTGVFRLFKVALEIIKPEDKENAEKLFQKLLEIPINVNPAEYILSKLKSIK